MKIRDRVKELRRVRAGDLAPSPKNWRTHPPAQQDALRGALAEIGYADALLARELPGGGLELVDGHLRAETTPDEEKLAVAVAALERIAESDPGPAYYVAKATLKEIRDGYTGGGADAAKTEKGEG